MKNHYNLFEKRGMFFWRPLFVFMALLLGSQIGWSQLTIPANNTYSGTNNRPLGAFYGYDRTLSVYTSSEMNIPTGSTITGIRYFCQIASTTVDLPTFVAMKNTGQSSYSPSIYNTGIIDATYVYGGTLPASDFVAGQWVTIPFTTPFLYTGSNLQIMVGTNYEESNADGNATKAFRWSNTSSAQTQYWNSNIQATFPGNGTVISSKPNIQILYDTPGAVGTLSFDYTATTMLENRTKTVAVNRSGGSTGTVSIDYATSNGTAIAGTDYNAASGTLTWTDGDMAPKLISITTLADFIQDDAETINITLSNPVGTTLVGANPSIVTITDVLPPMNGTYTVGTGGNYTSLTNAGGLFQALNNRVDGISGPVTINIISDLTGETGNIPLNEIPGGHTVLIQPFGAARTITGALSTTANLGLIRFEGTDNVTINGSLASAAVSDCKIGGDASLRQLTIINNSVGTTTAVLFNSATTGSYNNTLKNVNLVGYSPNVGYGIMFRVFPHSTQFPSAVNNQNCRVENCSVKKAGIGIYSTGSTTSNPNTNLVITANDISTTGAERVSKYAILIYNETNPQVTFNKVNINNTSTDSDNTVGIGIGAGQAYAPSVTSGGISGALVANNWITGVVSTVDLGSSTAGIAISGTAFGVPNVVKNNMISNVSGLAQNNYHVAGIWVVGAVASETKLYHNTISLYGDRGARSNQSSSYGIAISGLDPNVEMKNNIISTTQIATGGGLVKTYAFGTLSTTFANLVSDNNVFYSGGVQDGGFRSGSLANNSGTSYATLADWTLATSKDSHSVEVAPVFVAPTDLHLVAGSNPIIESTPGTPIASVTTDIDCNLRSTTTPAIGAQEINVSGYSISAAAGTGGTISPAGNISVAVGGNQSYTITANCGYAISDVLVDGVSQGIVSTYEFTGVNSNHIITATFSALKPTITASGPTTICIGTTLTLTSSSATGNVWSTGETTQSITALASANYWVAVDNGTCISPISEPVTVSIQMPQAAPTISTFESTTFCEGNSITLTSSALTGNVWSTGETTRSIVVSTAGSYTAYVNSGVCNSAPSNTITVTITPRDAAPVITPNGPTEFCQGGLLTLTSSSATGNFWSNGATTQSILVAGSGTFTVRSRATCMSLPSDPVVVTVTPTPTRPTITATGATTFCQGGSVILTSSATEGNIWSNGETTQAITVTTGGSYTVTSRINGCSSTASTARTVTVTPLPAAPTVTTSGATTFCTGGSVTLTSSSATGNTWSTGATTRSITVSTSGTYTVSVTSGSCTSLPSADTVVTVNAAPSIPTISASGATTFCNGGEVTLTSSSATGNVWSNGATTQSITVSSAGNYSVAVTTSGCPSVSSADTVVTVNAIPATPTISASGATTFCTGEDVILTSSSATGNVWSNGATTESITVSAAGNYSVAVTTNGCSSASSSDTIVTVNAVPSVPTISASGATTFCNGGDVTLTSSSATGNVWSNGATTQSITVSAAGNYSVAVTTNGCSSASSSDTIITVNAVPSVPTISASGATTFCNGGDVTLTSSSATGNLWSNGATTQSITVSAAGNYSVAVTQNGCSSASSSDTVVTVNALPDNTITQNLGVITATQSGASYQWYSCPDNLIDGATEQTYTPSVEGVYKVIVTLGNCSSTSECITVTELGNKGFDLNELKIYPNPVTNILNIEYTNELTTVSVYNMLGQMIISNEIDATTTKVDMSRLPSATYLVNVVSGNASKTFKVIKK